MAKKLGHKELDVKSFVTVSLVVTLEILTLGTLSLAFVLNDASLFTAVFGLFGAQVGSVVTYYFTRRSTDSAHRVIETDGEVAEES
jgi:hypothetical protein